MKIALVEVPYYFGREGFSMGAGPARYIEAGAADELQRTGFEVRVDRVRLDAPIDDDETAIAEVNSRVAAIVRKAREEGYFPLVLSGLCNTSLGVLGGIGSNTTGIIWFDAHGDFNTPETSLSGFLDGMGLAIATGRCLPELSKRAGLSNPVDESRVLLAATRDLDPDERDNIAASEITLVEWAEIESIGLAATLVPALEKLRVNTREIYLHLDVDVLDHDEAPANKYSPPGGLPLLQLEEAIGLIVERFTVQAATLSAYDPAYDPEEKTLRAGLRLMRRVAEAVAAGR